MGIRPAHDTPESQVVSLWQELAGRPDLVTEEGAPLRIISPGRVNRDGGADIVDAVIDQGGQSMRGDIEVHTESAGWRRHGHHLDPAYNGVILHVVLKADRHEAATRQDGRRIGTLSLARYAPDLPAEATDTVPCRDTGTRGLGRLLDRCGDARLRARARRLRASFGQIDTEECLYAAVMAALGYAKNKGPFAELARRLPLRALREAGPGVIKRQALLLGTAGMLPAPRGVCSRADAYVNELEDVWSRCAPGPPMPPGSWRLARVRVSNLPARRMIAMGHLVGSLWGARVADIVARIAGSSPGDLVRSLVVPADGYWQHHFDLGRPSRLPLPHLLGVSRAADIAVNALLPFALAWDNAAGRTGAGKQVLDLYHAFGRLQTNTIEQHMRLQIGLGTDTVNSARRQQGLLHLYKELCVRGNCQECPVTAAIRARRSGRLSQAASG